MVPAEADPGLAYALFGDRVPFFSACVSQSSASARSSCARTNAACDPPARSGCVRNASRRNARLMESMSQGSSTPSSPAHGACATADGANAGNAPSRRSNASCAGLGAIPDTGVADPVGSLWSASSSHAANVFTRLGNGGRGCGLRRRTVAGRRVGIGRVQCELHDHAHPASRPSRKGSSALDGSLGAQGRNRTADTRIFSPLLYRLSYLRKSPARRGRPGAKPASAALSSRRGRRSRSETMARSTPRGMLAPLRASS